MDINNPAGIYMEASSKYVVNIVSPYIYDDTDDISLTIGDYIGENGYIYPYKPILIKKSDIPYGI